MDCKNKYHGRQIQIVISLFSILLISYSTTISSGHAEDQIANSIQLAEGGLSSAFSAVFEAEKAGANASALMAKLNDAGRLLTEAEIAYRQGNLDESLRKAENSLSISENVKSQALDLKQLAQANANKAFWTNIIFSSIGSLVFIVALIFVWNRFRRTYVEKPEATPNANT